MKIGYKLIISLIVGYFVTYASLGFGAIIERGFLTRQFIVVLLINILLLFVFMQLPKLSGFNELTFGLKLSGLLLGLGTLSLHIFSAIFGRKLGPTTIQISSQQTLVTTNTFLIKLNIISLVILFIVSLLIGIVVDRNNISKKYLYWFIIILCLSIITYGLWPLINIVSLLIGFSTGG